MNLSQAIRLTNAPRVAFVGAGGKTTALFEIARELQPSLLTTTTHLGVWQVSKQDVHIIWKSGSQLPDIESSIGAGVTLVTGELEGDRFQGLDAGQLGKLKELAGYHDLPLLIEADGSRQKPLKAPAEHEPVIPEFVDTVIVVAGLSGLGKPLSDESVHRPDIFADLSGLKIKEPVTGEALANVLTHPSGGLKNIPTGSRRIVLLNQADRPDLQAEGQKLAQSILSAYDEVIIAALNPGLDQGPTKGSIFAVHEKTAGIILAAGGSTRFGSPKQLLDFHGKPFMRVIAETALAAGLEPVEIVTGAHAAEVEAAVRDLPVMVIRNPEWQAGQSSSIRAGISGLPINIGAAVFLLADQPQVTTSVLRALVERHAQDIPAVLAPYVLDRRANPVLFDRVTFPDLLKLEGDQGGRAIFSKFKSTYLDWLDERLLMDVDTPDDYRRLMDAKNDP
jgi:molybdenum cofactor cytidylyltransferase